MTGAHPVTVAPLVSYTAELTHATAHQDRSMTKAF